MIMTLFPKSYQQTNTRQCKINLYIYHFILFAFDLHNKITTQVVIVDKGN